MINDSAMAALHKPYLSNGCVRARAVDVMPVSAGISQRISIRYDGNDNDSNDIDSNMMIHVTIKMMTCWRAHAYSNIGRTRR